MSGNGNAHSQSDLHQHSHSPTAANTHPFAYFIFIWLKCEILTIKRQNQNCSGHNKTTALLPAYRMPQILRGFDRGSRGLVSYIVANFITIQFTIACITNRAVRLTDSTSWAPLRLHIPIITSSSYRNLPRPNFAFALDRRKLGTANILLGRSITIN